MSRWERASIKFDNDLTMYSMANTYALFPWSVPEIKMRGCKAHTSKGFVQLKRTPTAHQFWRITKNVANDTLRLENRRKLEKYGWHANNEIARDLIFTAESVSLLSRDNKWKDGKGVHVVTETRGLLALSLDLVAQRKDALLACWAAKCWLLESADCRRCRLLSG